MARIHGNDPTGYSYEAADDLRAAVKRIAGALDAQAPSRASYASTAKTEFRGYFADAFDRNATLCAQSAGELAEALRRLSGFVAELWDAALAEDKRRAEAKAWAQRQREREENFLVGVGSEIASWFGAKDDPRPPDPEPEPRMVAEEVSVRGRDIPQPGDGGSVSSAVPGDLRSFQTGTWQLDVDVRNAWGGFRGALTDYEQRCNPCWGSLDAQSLVSAIDVWLTANEADAQWAGALAAQFEAAGGGSGLVSLSDASLAAALAAAGVSVLRDDFTIAPFSAIGTPPTTGFADDPVNTATGNFLEPETDLVFPEASSSLAFTRMYNSLDPRVGVFGVGWASILDTRLELSDEGAAFVLDEGRQVFFPRQGEGWDRAVGENLWLAREAAMPGAAVAASAGAVLVVRDNGGGWWAFGASGAWLAAGRGPGTGVRVERDAEGRIERLVHERGRWVEVEYEGARVGAVRASDGRRVEYGYDGRSRLVSAAGDSGVRRYRWSEAGLVDRVISGAGVVECENVYDDGGRVVEQLTRFGRRVRFAYLPGRVTSVSNADGTEANTWVADRKGRVVGIVDADGARQSMAYDPQGNLVSVTERDRQVTLHAYDDRGRRIRTVTPEGADVAVEYDEQDRVTTLVAADGGVTELRYADGAERGPATITDPCGGVTALTWRDGLLLEAVDPEGVRVRFEYDEHGDLVAGVDGAGNRAWMVRDEAGRVVESVAPSGATTRFGYDEAGLLISRVDPDGAAWRFEREAGRVATVVDPLGARTRFEYGAHGEIVRTVDPLGRVVEREFDALGNVSGLVLPDGARWGFAHDALSRLRVVADPGGGAWTREYDRGGRLIATTDPEGVRTDVVTSRKDGWQTVQDAFTRVTTRFDASGRPTRVENEDGSAALTVYDPCGRPVELVDAEGGLTRIERDLAGRVIRVTTPAGRTTGYEYDSCGRPCAQTDSDGGRTVLGYDADSRVVSQTDPTGEVTAIEYDAAGRVVREAVPGAGESRYGYDPVGRLVSAKDGRFGRRRFRYDAAGQLVEAENGLGGVTRYDYDVRGRIERVTDPLGAVTTRRYTALDRVEATADPLHRVTTARYDAAGRQLSQTDPDGRTIEWVYDAAGREVGTRCDGRWVSRIVRDPRDRAVTVTDHTRPDGETVTHVLRFSPLGRLVERDSDGDVTRWVYDADGARIGVVTPVGDRVRYDRDRCGRVVRVAHSAFGEVTYAHDAAGRLTRAGTEAGEDFWTWEGGFLAGHVRVQRDEVSRTGVSRDEQGRITGVQSPSGTVEYGTDEAGQLSWMLAGDGTRSGWEYDVAGRLVRETAGSETGGGAVRDYAYDAAGQLASITAGDGATIRFAWDGAGRQVRAVAEGLVVEREWDGRGHLTDITTRRPDGSAARTEIWVDALGEPARVDGAALRWDAASAVPALLGVDGVSVWSAPGGITGIGDGWTPGTGWRPARSMDPADPWGMLRPLATLGEVGVATGGGFAVGGLEWLGARVYDPAGRGFLSPDPVAAPWGAGWGGNPYSFLGNDPVRLVDPWGLSPVTDAELAAYANGLQGPIAKGLDEVGQWWDENGAYVLGGAAIVVGVALMFTGFGGIAGAAVIGAVSGGLISGGASAISQKVLTGTVDMGQVGRDVLVGVVGGAVGGGVAAGLTKGLQVVRPVVLSGEGSVSGFSQVAFSVLKNTPVRAGLAGGSGGAASNVTDYALQGSPQGPEGYLQATVTGFATGGAGSYLTNRISSVASPFLGDRLTPNWLGAGSSTPHSGAPSNWGATITDQAINHGVGGLLGAANAAMQPTNNPDVLSGFIQGTVKGAEGTTVRAR